MSANYSYDFFTKNLISSVVLDVEFQLLGYNYGISYHISYYKSKYPEMKGTECAKFLPL